MPGPWAGKGRPDQGRLRTGKARLRRKTDRPRLRILRGRRRPLPAAFHRQAPRDRHCCLPERTEPAPWRAGDHRGNADPGHRLCPAHHRRGASPIRRRPSFWSTTTPPVIRNRRPATTKQPNISCEPASWSGLILLDHVIVGETEHYSYSDSGRLQELENE